MGFFADIEDAARQEARQRRRENTEPHQPEKQVPAETGTEHAAAPAPRPEPSAAPPKAAAPAPVPAPQITEAMCQDDMAAASVQRIREEIERITRRNMKDCVAAHLAQLCGPAVCRRPCLGPKCALAPEVTGQVFPLHQPESQRVCGTGAGGQQCDGCRDIWIRCSRQHCVPVGRGLF